MGISLLCMKHCKYIILEPYSMHIPGFNQEISQDGQTEFSGVRERERERERKRRRGGGSIAHKLAMWRGLYVQCIFKVRKCQVDKQISRVRGKAYAERNHAYV